jgi:hypothetical protein
MTATAAPILVIDATGRHGSPVGTSRAGCARRAGR